MQYKPIKSRKMYEEIADQIRDRIKTGELTPGDKLDSVQQLAEQFHVGRSAVREALSALRAMGLVEMRQGEGTFVREYDAALLSQSISTAVLMNQKDVKDLLELRKILEAGAARAAAIHRKEEDLAPMEKALEEMRAAAGNEQLGEQADLNFHLAVAGATHNRLLVNLMNSVSGMMAETMRETRRIWIYSRKTSAEQLYQEHQDIYRAIAVRDDGQAQQAMLTHLANVEEVLMKYFTETI